jgi:DNA-binding CsgD family transcriptional regulator
MAMDATSRLLLELYRGARESPIPEFRARALALLSSVLRFDSALWGSASLPSTGLAFHSVHLHNLPEEMLESYEEISSIDLAGVETIRRTGAVCNFNLRELMPGRRYAAVAAFDKRFEMRNLLVDTVYDKTIGTTTFIALYRANDRNRYCEVERLQGQLLLPHFLEAGTINRLLWLEQSAGAELAARGASAIASRLGTLCAYGAKFLDVLRMEWPEWSSPTLPRPLMEALGRSTVRQFVGSRISVDLALGHGMLFLRASEKPAIQSLTPAELAVASRIARGMSYKLAARDLSLSPSTVRNQLHGAYVKLGVGNKASLARLMSVVD